MEEVPSAYRTCRYHGDGCSYRGVRQEHVGECRRRPHASRVEGGTEEAEGTQGGGTGRRGVWRALDQVPEDGTDDETDTPRVQGQHVGVTGRSRALPERSIVGESASRGEHVKTLLGQEAKEKPGQWL